VGKKRCRHKWQDMCRNRTHDVVFFRMCKKCRKRDYSHAHTDYNT
jgi:hypothetical protein